MRIAASLLIVFWLAETPARPEPAIPYFTNVREVRVAEADRQNYFIVDEELWNHSRRDLGDLRLYDGDSLVQYAISEQQAGISSEEVEVKIINLGSVSGRTEFDLDAGGLAEYDRVRLRLDARDFVATAVVFGGSAPGKAAAVQLAPSTLYDFSKEQLGSNSLLKLPPSSFRFLHVRLTPGIRPQQVKGATIYNLREQKARWTVAGSCSAPQQKQHQTVIACTIPNRVPAERIRLEVAPAQVNFRRAVSVEDAKGEQIYSGEISRVRVNRGGMLVTDEELSPSFRVSSDRYILTIDNGENPWLMITAAEPLALERRFYFNPQGKSTLRLYYGDQRLEAPLYDYARFFHEEASLTEAQLGAGAHNPQYAGRPDDRPWSERHMGVLWGAMVVAVLALAALAIRGLRTETPR